MIKRLLKFILFTVVICVITVAGINLYIIIDTSKRIITEDKAGELKNDGKIDLMCVLGCSAKNGAPSKMLRERLDAAISLYNVGVCDKILMSGDHKSDYSEVNVMKKYAQENGVDEADILIDEKGFSTIETVENIKNSYGKIRCIFVTQNYHLYRTLYLAGKMGIDAYGLDCSKESFYGQLWREVREVGARVKDFATVNLLR